MGSATSVYVAQFSCSPPAKKKLFASPENALIVKYVCARSAFQRSKHEMIVSTMRACVSDNKARNVALKRITAELKKMK